MSSMSSNRLLIIDDDPQVARFVAKVAKACDYEATTTTSAEDFRARHGTWHPTHIVMDLQMPNTDGVELIRFLAAEKSKARLLIMSGQDVKVIEAVKHLGKERGLTMSGILSKPIRAAELRAILTNLKLASDAVDEDTLARAIQNGELFLVYQPKDQRPLAPFGGIRGAGALAASFPRHRSAHGVHPACRAVRLGRQAYPGSRQARPSSAESLAGPKP